MSESLFNKVAGQKAYSIIKTRLQHMCFPVKFVKSVTTFFYGTPLVAFYVVPISINVYQSLQYCLLAVSTISVLPGKFINDSNVCLSNPLVLVPFVQVNPFVVAMFVQVNLLLLVMPAHVNSLVVAMVR